MSINRWFPLPHQIVVRRNASYSRSLWIGFTAPILNLPRNLWFAVLSPLLMALRLVAMTVIVFPLCGLFGMLDAEDITLGEAWDRLVARTRNP